MLKRLAAFVCAVGMAVCGSFCAFAEPDENAAPETPKARGMEGPVMSASMIAVR